MAAGGKSVIMTSNYSLQDTPTWAVATVCFVFISLSIFIEHSIHLICSWLKRNKRTALFEAVEKLKSVLMLLGFMSLILAVTQRPISKICIPTKVAYTMLPCRKKSPTKTTKALGHTRLWTSTSTLTNNSFLMKDSLFEDSDLDPMRRLAGSTSSISTIGSCESQGKTSFMSEDGITQLSYFIFVLAVMQIVYSVLTMALGRAKMKTWEAWEKETQTLEYQVSNDPHRFRYTRQTTFGRRHMDSSSRTSILLWVKCFFRQFFHSVAKVDYFTLRHGFISTHLSTNNSFDFQKYIERSLEDDFKVVVGIRPFMWFIVVIFMLLDVHGWHVYLWISFIPLLIVLVLGTKLEVVVAQMAFQLHNKNRVIIGTPLVQPNDNLFWFSHPKFVLTLLHYTLFMNAFELAFFVWVTLEFGIHSCYHEHVDIIIIRVVLAVTVQVMCSYITLPLYALVTQMGSNFKSAVLEEHTVKLIKQWHAEAKQKKKKNHEISQSGQDYSYTSVELDYNNTTTTVNNSPEFSSHHRAPTFSHEILGQSEIVELQQEIIPQHVSSTTNMVHLEIQEVGPNPAGQT